MGRKNQGKSTTLSESQFPNSEIPCRFCGSNENQEDMTVQKRPLENGQTQRTAYHRRCFAAYKLRNKPLKGSFDLLFEDEQADKLLAQLEANAEAEAQNANLYNRLVNSL